MNLSQILPYYMKNCVNFLELKKSEIYPSLHRGSDFDADYALEHI